YVSTLEFFFFSSRRRHTRFSRDWSSDVCSSDLLCRRAHGLPAVGRSGHLPAVADAAGRGAGPGHLPTGLLAPLHADAGPGAGLRSEEHTSELQSRENLVCRLLPERKKDARERT